MTSPLEWRFPKTFSSLAKLFASLSRHGILAAVGWICWSRNCKLLNKGSNFHICVGIFWQPFQEMSALPGLCLGCSGHLKAFSQADSQWLLPTTLSLTAGLLLKLQRFPSPHRETLPTQANKTESCYIKQLELWSNCVFSVRQNGKLSKRWLPLIRVHLTLHLNKTGLRRDWFGGRSFLLPRPQFLVC